MKNRRNYYRILQVQPDAPLEIIRACYHTLMHTLKKHPDLGGEHWNAVILNEAYETLSDMNKRAEYDKMLFEFYIKKPFPKVSSHKKPFISIFCPFCKRPLARKAKPGESCPTCRSPLQSNNNQEVLNRDYNRSVNRIKRSGNIRYYSYWPQRGQKAKIIDLSPRGIRFLCCEELKQKLIVKLSSPLLKAIVKVVNTQKKEIDGKAFYTIGAQFLTVTFANPKGSFFSTVV